MPIWKVKKRQKKKGKNQHWLVSWLRTRSWIDTKLEKYQLVGKGYFAKKIQKDPHPGSGVKKAGNLIPTNWIERKQNMLRNWNFAEFF